MTPWTGIERRKFGRWAEFYARVARELKPGEILLDGLQRLAAEDALAAVKLKPWELAREREERGNKRWRQDVQGDAARLLGCSRQTVMRLALVYPGRRTKALTIVRQDPKPRPAVAVGHLDATREARAVRRAESRARIGSGLCT